MNKIKSFILDLIFPNRCPICSEFISFDSNICQKCKESLDKFTADGICPVCGKLECICSENIYYDRAAVCFFYENEVRTGILSLKDGHKEFGNFLGNMLAQKISADIIMQNADFIIPVPMSKEGLRERGYNQAEVIAKEISDKTGIDIKNDILYKNSSEVQHSLNIEQRHKNVSAFCINNVTLTGKRIILCDDVITTGSTVNKCAQLLKSRGADSVYAAAGATTKLKKEG
ncbi:ComF family protein [Porcipelethomonas sp.]|uniref:ComF family protein n=1 Tax=Porcipelethomonas sp. TaxID=2981675 RepID=UPI003EF7803A